MRKVADVEAFYQEFFKELGSRIEEQIGGEVLDAHSLCVGWAIAKGLTDESAIQFALYARYTRHYGK